jgi:zeaxanthin glucosyltransferase
MTHFGIISPPVSGHIHPFGALGRALIARGHRVTCLQMIDLEQKIRSEGLDFEALGASDHPRGSLPASLDALGRRKGLSALRFTIQAVAKTTDMVCREAPDAIRRLKIDALLVDQMEPAGGAVAEHVGIPFITVCNALPINRDPIAPPAFSPWQYRSSGWMSARNAIGYGISDWLTRPVTRVVAEHRARWKLAPLRSPDDSFSKLAQLSQLPREFDFPRVALPPQFHYVGPLRRAGLDGVDFPWGRLDGRPLVYASLGTLQNSREDVFRCFATACEGLNVQLVISHGGGLTDAQASSLPGAPLVVRYAPQRELLQKARLTLTHAGLNTVLDSLAYRVPVVAVPITYEQPSIARRVEWHTCGESIALSRLTARRLRQKLISVLENARYGAGATRIGEGISRAGGVDRATVVIETAVKQYRFG